MITDASCSKPKHMHSFSPISSVVTALERVPEAELVLSATADGSVTVWDISAMDAKFKLRMGAGIAGLSFASAGQLVAFGSNSLHVLLLRHFFTTFAACNSAPQQLELVAPGTVMVSCVVRILIAAAVVCVRCCRAIPLLSVVMWRAPNLCS